MKKLLSFGLLVALLLSFLPVSIAQAKPLLQNAQTVIISQVTVPGGVITTTLEVFPTTYSTSSTRGGTKTANFSNNSGQIMWSFSVTGSFEYDGRTSTCTSASHSLTINNSDWHEESSSSYASGNQAIGNVTMDYIVDYILLQRISRDITLTCDANGILS